MGGDPYIIVDSHFSHIYLAISWLLFGTQVNDLGILLLHEPTHSTRGDNKYLSQMLSIKLKATYETNPVRKKYRDIIYFILDIRYSFKGILRGAFFLTT